VDAADGWVEGEFNAAAATGACGSHCAACFHCSADARCATYSDCNPDASCSAPCYTAGFHTAAPGAFDWTDPLRKPI